jgi:hypothetical protein
MEHTVARQGIPEWGKGVVRFRFTACQVYISTPRLAADVMIKGEFIHLLVHYEWGITITYNPANNKDHNY